MSSQIKIFTCSNIKHLTFHFIISIKRGLSFKEVVDTLYYPCCYVSFLFLLRPVFWYPTISAKCDISSICVLELKFLKNCSFKGSRPPHMIFFNTSILHWTGLNKKSRCEKEKYFITENIFIRNDEGLYHQEEKWAEFLMYKSEIQSCVCQMDMSEKVTVVFCHFMTQTDSYQSQMWPIEIMDIGYLIDLIRQVLSYSLNCILSSKTSSTLKILHIKQCKPRVWFYKTC